MFLPSGFSSPLVSGKGLGVSSPSLSSMTSPSPRPLAKDSFRNPHQGSEHPPAFRYRGQVWKTTLLKTYTAWIYVYSIYIYILCAVTFFMHKCGPAFSIISSSSLIFSSPFLWVEIIRRKVEKLAKVRRDQFNLKFEGCKQFSNKIICFNLPPKLLYVIRHQHQILFDFLIMAFFCEFLFQAVLFGTLYFGITPFLFFHLWLCEPRETLHVPLPFPRALSKANQGLKFQPVCVLILIPIVATTHKECQQLIFLVFWLPHV